MFARIDIALNVCVYWYRGTAARTATHSIENTGMMKQILKKEGKNRKSTREPFFKGQNVQDTWNR